MPNLYHDSAGACAPSPPLEGGVRADVVIVGGGLTGLSTALHLAERGVRVALLESVAVGFGASGRNGGQVNPGLKPDPDAVEAHFGADLGARINGLAGGAPAVVFDLIERHGIDCGARRNGTLRAAWNAAHAEGVERTAAQWQRRGAPVEVLRGPALERATGTSRYRAALLDRRGGDLQPLRYARGLARAARGAGATIYEGSAAHAVRREQSLWRVETRSGYVDAEQVVIATNGYSDDLWPGLKRSVVPVFGALAATAPLPAALARSILPERPVLYESGAITVYYRIDLEDRLLIGGRGPMREIHEPQSIAHLLAYAQTLWPGLRGTVWTHAWGGQLAMTRDHYPHLHAPAPGVWICLGYNGRGVAMATALGAHLARHLVDPGMALDLPISPIEPIALHVLWPWAVRGAILRGRLNDALGSLRR
jgi:glycine/D-amino acid oxidase-like deaminating enzyme